LRYLTEGICDLFRYRVTLAIADINPETVKPHYWFN